MTSPRESELLTRIGPGTPMGAVMRQYWIPAAKSSELAAGAPPLRLMLLGERLIAFRDAAGRVGVMDHRCPHRCASLYFGRNEGDGLRCIYHGWKFDAAGACLEMPNVKPHQDFRDKVRARAYPTFERNGLVWAYMGDRAEPPPMPLLEPVLLPEDEVRILFVQRECNWLQALEGDIDTSHFSFLHAGAVDPDDVDPTVLGRHNLIDRAPDYEVADTAWGTMYGAWRAAGPGRNYWRVAHFLFPFWTMPPDGDFEDHVIARAWVPMDDTHTMFVHVSWMRNKQGLRTRKDGAPIPGMQLGMEYLPNGSGWYDRWRLAANAGNDYLIDRAAQGADEIFSGITGIHLQDQAVTESMGGIVDHAFETLAPSDLMIARTRRRLMQAARALAEDGRVPPGVDDPEICLGARGGDYIAEEGGDWREHYRALLGASTNPTGRLQAAE